MDRPYDRVLRCQGNELRVMVDDDTCIAHYNGHHVAEKTGDVGVLVFEVRENGLPVTYDIAALRSGRVRIFVGRNGRLIYSDDAAFPVDLTDHHHASPEQGQEVG